MLPEKRTRERVLTPEEVSRLLMAPPQYLRDVIIVGLHTALRCRELQVLRRDDIDGQRRLLTGRAKIAKNHKARRIPLDDAA